MWWRIFIKHKNGKEYFIDASTRRNVSDHVAEQFRQSFVKSIRIERSGPSNFYYDFKLDKVYSVKLLNKPLNEKEHKAVKIMTADKSTSRWWHFSELGVDLKTMQSLQKRGFVKHNIMINRNVPIKYCGKTFFMGYSQNYQLTSHAFYYKREVIDKNTIYMIAEAPGLQEGKND